MATYQLITCKLMPSIPCCHRLGVPGGPAAGGPDGRRRLPRVAQPGPARAWCGQDRRGPGAARTGEGVVRPGLAGAGRRRLPC